MVFIPIIALFLIQSSLAILEESYPENVDVYGIYPDDLPETDDIEVHRRNSNFLRFGRNNGKYENSDSSYEDYDEYARPTRRTEKNDHFIRFGRGNKQAFLRFGRDPQQRVARGKSSVYLRFGRSIADEGKTAKRSKREVFPEEKRSDSFLRFGKSANYMRFGRDPDNADGNPHPQFDVLKLKQLSEPTLIRLLVQLLVRKQAEKQCASAA